jgi:hypothetical protein
MMFLDCPAYIDANRSTRCGLPAHVRYRYTPPDIPGRASRAIGEAEPPPPICPALAQTSRTDGWFEVIAGKAIPADGRPACFGYVQTYDTKPKRRLFEVLNGQGMQANQQVT